VIRAAYAAVCTQVPDNAARFPGSRFVEHHAAVAGTERISQHVHRVQDGGAGQTQAGRRVRQRTGGEDDLIRFGRKNRTRRCRRPDDHLDTAGLQFVLEILQQQTESFTSRCPDDVTDAAAQAVALFE
jgi:hypothetical protein